jgi:hypothetical protein
VPLAAVQLYFSLTVLQSVTGKGFFNSLFDCLQFYSAVKKDGANEAILPQSAVPAGQQNRQSRKLKSVKYTIYIHFVFYVFNITNSIFSMCAFKNTALSKISIKI